MSNYRSDMTSMLYLNTDDNLTLIGRRFYNLFCVEVLTISIVRRIRRQSHLMNKQKKSADFEKGLVLRESLLYTRRHYVLVRSKSLIHI